MGVRTRLLEHDNVEEEEEAEGSDEDDDDDEDAGVSVATELLDARGEGAGGGGGGMNSFSVMRHSSHTTTLFSIRDENKRLLRSTSGPHTR